MNLNYKTWWCNKCTKTFDTTEDIAVTQSKLCLECYSIKKEREEVHIP